MIKLVHNLEFIETSSASEALLLEASLVRAHQPPFNVLLKDDKRYPYVCITWSKEYPEIFITRRKSHKDIEKVCSVALPEHAPNRLHTG
jgi:excinuclease ABC subunit C